MMNWILWLALGALAGYLARLLLGRNKGVWWQDMLVGAFGAVIGGYIATALGLGPVTGLNLYSLLVAIFGAAVLTLIIEFIRRRLS